MRYRAYFPPGYPHEERARAVLSDGPYPSRTVRFLLKQDGGPYSEVEELCSWTSVCHACYCKWQVWVPREMMLGPTDPGKCPACSPVAAELEPEERARLLAELLALDPPDPAELAPMLEANSRAIMSLVVACDAAQSSRAVPEYRSPRDITRIEELENALASVGLLV